MQLYSYTNMKHNFRHIVLPIAIISIFFIVGCNGCGENTSPAVVGLNTQITWGGENIAIGDTVIDFAGRQVRPEKLICYISNISLRQVDGNWISSESLDRLDFMPNSDFVDGVFPFEMIEETYVFDSIRFSVGVPEELNTDVVPSNYPNDHPLGVVGSADMHWPMMSTYFTMKLEGKVADISGEEIITPFAMHPATNPLYRTLSFELPETMALYPNEIRNYQFNLDLEKTINGNAGIINLNEIGHSMGNVENTVRFVDNLSTAWTLIE